MAGFIHCRILPPFKRPPLPFFHPASNMPSCRAGWWLRRSFHAVMQSRPVAPLVLEEDGVGHGEQRAEAIWRELAREHVGVGVVRCPELLDEPRRDLRRGVRVRVACDAPRPVDAGERVPRDAGRVRHVEQRREVVLLRVALVCRHSCRTGRRAMSHAAGRCTESGTDRASRQRRKGERWSGAHVLGGIEGL
ncbi:unnamed protein product [Urochloa humidicola]